MSKKIYAKPSATLIFANISASLTAASGGSEPVTPSAPTNPETSSTDVPAEDPALSKVFMTWEDEGLYW